MMIGPNKRLNTKKILGEIYDFYLNDTVTAQQSHGMAAIPKKEGRFAGKVETIVNTTLKIIDLIVLLFCP